MLSKGKIYAVVLFLFTGLTASAQLSIGPKVGVNFALARIDTTGPFIHTTVRPNIGAVLEWRLAGSFALQPEVAYIGRGYRLETFDPFIGNIETSTFLNYLDVALMGKLTMGCSRVRAYLIAGPSMGYAVSGTTKSNNVESTIDFDFENYRRLDIGLGAGAGLLIPFGNIRTFIDARHIWGLNRIRENTPRILNRGTGVTIGAMVPL